MAHKILNLEKATAYSALIMKFWERVYGWPFTWNEEIFSDTQMDELISGLGWSVLALHRSSLRSMYWLESEEVTGVFDKNRTSWDVQLAATTIKAGLAAREKISRLLPPIKSDESTVPVSFWSLGQHGPIERVRSLFAPLWEDLATNYPQGVGGRLGNLMELSHPTRGGKLILLHGRPGTGKTYAIRALARQWRGWCGCYYIVDPDEFLEHAEYMMGVVLSGGDTSTPASKNGEPKEKKWTLIIMEDVDEYLTVDAKMRSGQSMSRLLNLGDGFVGQGLNLLLLLTTNEPVEHLHPAIVRLGRCLADIEFSAFSPKEAQNWLRRRGLEEKVGSGEVTLAEMFGVVEQAQIRTREDHPVGFHLVTS